jgi:SH3 domain protein
MTQRTRDAGAIATGAKGVRVGKAGPRFGRRALGLASLALLLFAGLPMAAETGWVKDELSLNLRTGPGTQYRIKGAIKTGESVQIMSQREGWTEVRTSSLGDGWIPEGFLQPEMPAGMRLEKTLSETAEFRGQFTSLTDRVKELETTNAELTSADTEQNATIESLTRENLELKAGARWPEWITGAGILCAGMLMGAIIQSMNGRRSRPRIRL